MLPDLFTKQIIYIIFYISLILYMVFLYVIQKKPII
jgi:hypothetical protein